MYYSMDVALPMQLFLAVSRGSILGPLLFLFYVNNIGLSNLSQFFILVLADDTNVFATGTDLRSFSPVKSKSSICLLVT